MVTCGKTTARASSPRGTEPWVNEATIARVDQSLGQAAKCASQPMNRLPSSANPSHDVRPHKLRSPSYVHGTPSFGSSIECNDSPMESTS